MREHPIPQDIVGYRFHIVGNMTIKQFAEVCVGCAVAFVFYKTNLFMPLKWTLIGLSVSLGAAMAFVPFEERPLDHWFTTFFVILYKPTKYFWKRQAKIPDPFLYKPVDTTKKVEAPVDLSPARRQRIKEYLSSVQTEVEIDPYDQQRQVQINAILESFSTYKTLGVSNAKITQKPSLRLRVRSLRRATTTDASYYQESQQTTSVATAEVGWNDQDLAAAATDDLRESITLRTPLAVSQVAQDIEVPEMAAVEVDEVISEEDIAAYQQQESQLSNEAVYVETNQPEPLQSTTTFAATTNQALPFPSKPTQPNKLVGMVLTPSNDVITNAIVEIKKANGTTVRAVKTNALGQFFISTPLPDGEYVIETEKSDLRFAQLNISLSGKIVDPLEIRSIV
jgi:hypothetical protein